MKKKKFLALIGYGYWGKNLARDFNSLGVLKAVSDVNHKTQSEVKLISENILFKRNYKDLLKDSDITSVAIATPAKSHYHIVKECLIAKKNVFVEKPLCLNYSDGKKLVTLAKKNKLKLMVGHLMLYNPAFIKMIETIKKEWNINLASSFMIGDKITDYECAKKSKIKFFYYKKDIYKELEKNLFK